MRNTSVSPFNEQVTDFITNAFKGKALWFKNILIDAI